MGINKDEHKNKGMALAIPFDLKAMKARRQSVKSTAKDSHQQIDRTYWLNINEHNIFRKLSGIHGTHQRSRSRSLLTGQGL